MLDEELVQMVEELSLIIEEKKACSYETLIPQIRYLIDNHYSDFMKALFAVELSFAGESYVPPENIDRKIIDEIYERYIKSESSSILSKTAIEIYNKWLQGNEE